ncbi:MAG: hypothetical protein JF597_47265 [Streptomyces sp.]|uniref:hypothetical protein n=1 Tax=Streptomyces sp. TaxID=1931 RepID=UPI0025CEBFEB|nr:hypothetical protein [Streptomyces sp.]MBW8800890.1 hypothetical protein [Streptomyces sp.]
MKYALVIFETEESRRRIQADRAAYRKEYEGWIGGLAAAGKLVGGDALETEHTACGRRDINGDRRARALGR